MIGEHTTLDKITGAIFDLDGTILDSMFIWTDIGFQFLKNKNFTPPKGAEEEFITMSLVQAAEYYIEHYDKTATIQGIVEDINLLVHDFYFYEVVAKPHVKEFLELLKSRGVKMCIATATDEHLVREALKRNGFLHYFSKIFTCTNVGAGKDTPVIYNKALEHLKTDKTTTFVFEDALYAIKTAHNAGYKIVGINDVSEKADVNTVKKYCDYYINDYSEIFKYFEV